MASSDDGYTSMDHHAIDNITLVAVLRASSTKLLHGVRYGLKWAGERASLPFSLSRR